MAERPLAEPRAGAAAAPRAGAAAAALDCRVSGRDVDLRLAVSVGRRLAIVGPNGAGKTTAVDLLAGHLRPDAGTVHLHGRVVSSPGLHVPAHHRRVVSLEQRPALLPHLTALHNVAYGPRSRGVRRRPALDRARTELESVGCADLADRRPHELSGGQAQRVALARALAVDPEVVLLDEPLAALDVEVAPGIRRLLADRLTGRTVVMVTHDPLDLWALADDVVVVSEGRAVQSGTVEGVLTRPGSDFAARLAGVSLLEGTVVDDDSVHTPGGDTVTGHRPDGAPGWAPGVRAIATIDPRAVALHAVDSPAGTATVTAGCAADAGSAADAGFSADAGFAADGFVPRSLSSPRNAWPARVVELAPAGALTRVTAELRDGQRVDAEVTSRSAAELALAPGVDVTLVVKAAQVALYPRS
ncbi:MULTISPECIES: ABC transporter ATP-binding protein [unclassified Dietzia]|uniref:ABC transporter ATP-binding protein n=1 Tax=unclassified Dietzia TaxID=2617939 RepID=UPI000D223FA6|nr:MULTISPECIES: ATP-binding cassette domain-containing protein [unclassified Dietzia]AVZ40143.1 ABC transporter ATP-binding protein [Dietzia sp. JS16-p6b]QGW25577.1 ABC transporter-related protein [Dietzia sp. DQ12-45-1b]